MLRPPRLSTNAAAYFEDICTSLDSEEGMRDFCRDTFEDAVVPKSDKKALELITLDLKHRYLFDAKSKIERWGLVQSPQSLIDKYADRILAKLVKKNTLDAKKSSGDKKKASIKKDEFDWGNYFEEKYLGMALSNRVLRGELESAHAKISLLENQLLPLQKN